MEPSPLFPSCVTGCSDGSFLRCGSLGLPELACGVVCIPQRDLLWDLRVFSARLMADSELFTEQKRVRRRGRGSIEGSAAHLWLWGCYSRPGTPHQPPMPLTTLCLVKSHEYSGITQPRCETLTCCCGLPCLPPDAVSQWRGSWVHTSQLSCLAKVGPWWHSRRPEEGEIESLARCQDQVGLGEDCTMIAPVSIDRARQEQETPSANGVCGEIPSLWDGRCSVTQGTDPVASWLPGTHHIRHLVPGSGSE